jgi:hypothetical protein
MRSCFPAILVAAALVAGPTAASTRADGASFATGFSAAKKKKKPAQKKPAHRTRSVHTAPAPGWTGFRPADPSFDRSGRPYRPPPGLSCPVDLGYGRWGSCDTDY